MIVRRPRIELDRERARLAARVESESGAFVARDLHLAVPRAHADWLDASGNPWVPTLILLAGTLGERLVVEAPVSSRLLAAAPLAARQWKRWWNAAAADVVADAAAPDVAPPGTETLCCFTRGVDSWFATLRLTAPAADPALTRLLYVPAFDRHYSAPRRREAVRRTREAADALGLPLLVVLEHDARELLDPFVVWDHSHGSVLAGVALALGGGVGTFVIPGTHDRAHLPSHGSHPDVDPLWSTERTRVVYDAAEVPRTAKVRAVAASPIALPRLKVCWEADVDGNCGRCKKCLRTMLQLAFAGVVDAAPFDAPLTMDAFTALPPPRRELRRMLFTELYDGIPADPAWDGWRALLRARLSRWHPDAPLAVAVPDDAPVVVEAPAGSAVGLAAPSARVVLPGPLVVRAESGADVEPPAGEGARRLAVSWTTVAPGATALPWRPTASERERMLLACRAAHARPVPWCLLEPPSAGSAALVRALTAAWGAGLVHAPVDARPDTDHGTPPAVAADVQWNAAARVWRGDGRVLDPFRVLSALTHGCLPLQCVDADEWELLRPALAPGLDAFVLVLADDGLAPLDRDARLERGLGTILAGSLERDLHRALDGGAAAAP